MDTTEIQSSKETKRSEDEGRKQRKQHQSPEHMSHETDKERTKKSRGHSSDRKKSSRVCVYSLLFDKWLWFFVV